MHLAYNIFYIIPWYYTFMHYCIIKMDEPWGKTNFFSCFPGRPQNNCQDPGTTGLLLRTTAAKKSFKSGTKLSYYCPHKFILKGSKELVCRRDGTWSASLPQCTGKTLLYVETKDFPF
jgi:hypothetical protein